MTTATATADTPDTEPRESLAARAASAAKSGRKRAIGVAVLLAAASGAGAYAFLTRGFEGTDNAQVDADVVAIAPRASGMVVRVNVADNQSVKAGDVLLELDAEPFKARLAQAEASYAAALASAEAAEADAHVAAINAHGNKGVAEASLYAASAGAFASKEQIAEGDARVSAAEVAFKQATMDKERAERLFKGGALSKAEFDQSATGYDASRAALAQARAHVAALRSQAAQADGRVTEANAKVVQTKDVTLLVAQAEARAKAARAQAEMLKAARDLAALDLSYTRVTAPQDGTVSKRTASVGQQLPAGSPALQLIPSAGIWITANFKETQVEAMRAGQPVTIEVDAYSRATLKGEVESFSAATGSKFTLLPPDNATGNYTKIVQRVPVKIKIVERPENLALRPGMSAVVSVNTRR